MPILFITVLIDLIGFGIIIPILPFMAPQVGADNMDIALLIASYSIFGGIVGPFWGKLSDRIGRKPVLLICLSGAAVSYVILAFAHTLTMLYVSRIIAGIMSGNFGVASAMVADITEPKDRAKYMGIMGSAFGLGMVIGPFLGGILSGDDGDFMLPGLVAAGLSAAALLAGLLFLKESHGRDARAFQKAEMLAGALNGNMFQTLKRSGNSLLVFQYFLNNTCHTCFSYLFPLWVGVSLAWGAREVGMTFGAIGVTMAILQAGVIGLLVRKMGELRLLAVGASLMCAGFILAILADSEIVILLAFFISVTGGTIGTPVLNALLTNRSAPSLRGQMMGMGSSSSAFGRMFGPLGAGILLSQLGYTAAWSLGIVASLLILVWAISQLRLPEDNTEDASASSNL